MPDEFTVKDSGKMAEYPDGMRRDTTEGKPKFSLLWPEGIPYEEQLMYRVALHYAKGGEKYGDRNWEQSSSEESLAHHIDATERHLHKFLRGVEDGEDHAAAVVWGINAVLLTRRKIREKLLEAERLKAEHICVQGLRNEHAGAEQWCHGTTCLPDDAPHQHGSADPPPPDAPQCACTGLCNGHPSQCPHIRDELPNMPKDFKMPCTNCGKFTCRLGQVRCEDCAQSQEMTGYERRQLD